MAELIQVNLQPYLADREEQRRPCLGERERERAKQDGVGPVSMESLYQATGERGLNSADRAWERERAKQDGVGPVSRLLEREG
jgi:hypothetical protein